jgi:hypothetical protein
MLVVADAGAADIVVEEEKAAAMVAVAEEVEEVTEGHGLSQSQQDGISTMSWHACPANNAPKCEREEPNEMQPRVTVKLPVLEPLLLTPTLRMCTLIHTILQALLICHHPRHQ